MLPLNRISLIFTCCLLLTGCVGLQQTAQTPSSISWKARQLTLKQLSSWTNQGAIAIRAPQNAWSASYTWQQLPNAYDLQLFGPLGLGSLAISGNAHKVELTTSKGERFTALSAKDLLYQRTGWYLPVEVLRYWVVGLPAPYSPAKLTFDAQQRLSSIHQQGWTVHYKSYATVTNIDLPSLLTVESESLSIRLAIKKWSFSTTHA